MERFVWEALPLLPASLVDAPMLYASLEDAFLEDLVYRLCMPLW